MSVPLMLYVKPLYINYQHHRGVKPIQRGEHVQLNDEED